MFLNIKKMATQHGKVHQEYPTISQNHFQNQDATWQKNPLLNPTQIRWNFPVFVDWFVFPWHLLNRLPCLVTVSCIRSIGGFLVWNFSERYRSKNHHHYPAKKTFDMRSYFLKGVAGGIGGYPWIPMKTRILQTPTWKKGQIHNMDLIFFLEAIQSNILEALQDILRTIPCNKDMA